MGVTLSQLWPPAPVFTEKDVPDLTGKVIIITGASSGVGKELARLLYMLNAKTYLAGRSESRVQAAIDQIQSQVPDSRGELKFLEIELEDLESVKKGAERFLALEDELDVLIHNAGVMMPPEGSITKQGLELQLGVHALAPLLLTKLLTPILEKTVRNRDTGTVRVVWVASSAAELASPKGGIEMDNLDYSRMNPAAGIKYGTSKAAQVILHQEYSQRHSGIISIACNPGNIKTDLRRHLSWPTTMIFGWMSHDPVKGAYTELYCGFSNDLVDKTGCWVIPWGRISPIRKDLAQATLPESDGGTGIGEKFWKWCETQLEAYTTRR